MSAGRKSMQNKSVGVLISRETNGTNVCMRNKKILLKGASLFQNQKLFTGLQKNKPCKLQTIIIFGFKIFGRAEPISDRSRVNPTQNIETAIITVVGIYYR